MASRVKIKACLAEDKGTWVVRARFPDVPGGEIKLHSKTTGLKVSGRNKRNAEALMDEIVRQWEEEVNSRVVLIDEITFGQCIESWLETKSATVNYNTVESYEVHYRAHIKTALGSIKLRDLTRRDIQQYFNSLNGVVSSVTMRKHLVIIRGALEEAVLNGWLLSDAGNVLTKVSLPKKDHFEGKILTNDQIKTLFQRLAEEPEPVRAGVILGLCYGLRRSEICGLRWEDVDFEAGVLHIRNTVTDYNGVRVEQERTKTLKSRRDIPMIGNTIGYLMDLYEKRQAQGMVSDKVCAHEDGREVIPNYVTRHVMDFLKRCGIEGIRLHDLRHTVASVLVKRMPSVLYVSEFLGHNQVSTTLNIYSHVLDEEREKAPQEVNTFLNGLMAGEKEPTVCAESVREIPVLPA